MIKVDIKLEPKDLKEKLKFDEKFVKAIKEGVKTSTIRANSNLKIGDTALALSKGKLGLNVAFGELLITDVKRIRYDEIDKDISRTEGYLHEDLVKIVLQDYYYLEDSSLLYYIQFEYHPLEKEE